MGKGLSLKEKMSLLGDIYEFDSWKKEDLIYNGYEVYSVWNKEEAGCTVGTPRFVLSGQNGSWLLATYGASLEILDMLGEMK